MNCNSLCKTAVVARNVVGKKLQLTKGFVSSRVRSGAAGHGHDDHAHHVHYMWEKLPFKKSTIAALVWGGTGVGTGLVLFACWFQQKKHGYYK